MLSHPTQGRIFDERQDSIVVPRALIHAYDHGCLSGSLRKALDQSTTPTGTP
jgi:hypothetical protein